MNTREIAAECRLAHWTQIIRRRSESGLSIKAFCASEGFHENKYYYWQRKLREAVCEQMTEIGTEHAQTSLIPTGFAELQIAEAHERQTLQENGGQGQIRIDIAGMLIAADSAYPAEKIAALLAALKRSC